MSLPQAESNEEHKITTVDNSETKGDAGKCKNKEATFQSNGSENQGSKQLKNNHSNNCHDGPSSGKGKTNLASSLEGLKLSDANDLGENACADNESTQDEDCLMVGYRERIADNIVPSKSTSFPGSNDKFCLSDSPHSESLIGTSKSTCANSVSKVLAWDPWDKLGRKSKKENKRRKCEKNNDQNRSPSPKDKNRKDFKAGDEARSPGDGQQLQQQPQQQAEGYEYEYQPYQKNIRSVDFTNNVMVVYINKEDKVVGETSEPLKKELEQQIRNKEMRKGHMPDVAFAKRSAVSDFFKK